MPRLPFRRRTLLLATLMGLLSGVGGFTFRYAEGFSYFSTDPKACANCHIMWPEYDSWQRSGHHHVAGCVDCHLPHDLVPKLIAKAENGYHHSAGFTLQNFHEPIIIGEKNARILQESCIRCHADFVHQVVPGSRDPKDPNGVQCVHCHQSVGHGPRAWGR
ncbi:MAG TPA: cytochrome c nitrite reductase small subunit [Humisphaera sp.]